MVIGGALGAPARFLIDRTVQRRHPSVFPWGTLSVNVLGCLLLGVVGGGVRNGAVPAGLQLLVGTGFCGALTTFSTFGFETVRLLEEGSVLEAGLNAVASLVLGVLAATAGLALSTAIP